MKTILLILLLGVSIISYSQDCILLFEKENDNLKVFNIKTNGIGFNPNIYELFQGSKVECIAELFSRGIGTFNVPMELDGMQIKNILKVPVYEDNILTRYENEQAIFENHVLTGFTEKENPSKEYFARKWNWITKNELKIKLISGYKPTDYIFSATISAKKVRKNEPFFDFAVSLNNQNTPQKKNKELLTAYLIYLDTSDGFSIDADGNVINPFPEYVEIKQITKNIWIENGEIKELK